MGPIFFPLVEVDLMGVFVLIGLYSQYYCGNNSRNSSMTVIFVAAAAAR